MSRWTPPAPLADLRTVAALVLIAALAGCSGRYRIDDQPPIETRSPVLASQYKAEQAEREASRRSATRLRTTELGREDGAPGASGRIVYFDFDSFVVHEDYRAMLEGHARALAAAGARRVVIEGHTDERGGSEYNLALGQKRAEAVLKSLELLGASANQMEAVSYGKERPVMPGSDEASWARNRRAEIKDQ